MSNTPKHIADAVANLRQNIEDTRTYEDNIVMVGESWLTDVLDFIDPPAQAYKIEGELTEEECDLLQRWLDKSFTTPTANLCSRLLSMVKREGE